MTSFLCSAPTGHPSVLKPRYKCGDIFQIKEMGIALILLVSFLVFPVCVVSNNSMRTTGQHGLFLFPERFENTILNPQFPSS